MIDASLTLPVRDERLFALGVGDVAERVHRVAPRFGVRVREAPHEKLTRLARLGRVARHVPHHRDEPRAQRGLCPFELAHRAPGCGETEAPERPRRPLDRVLVVREQREELAHVAAPGRVPRVSQPLAQGGAHAHPSFL
jgi:hypothetical protein